MELEAQVQVLAERVATLGERVALHEQALNGPRGSGSVRDRLHTIEGSLALSKAASEALQQARRENREARATLAVARREGSNRHLKVLTAAIALVVGLYPYVAHFAGW